MKIRNLVAGEIECRALRVGENYCILTLYKDARCDMKILDEVFGPFGWQRTHEVINGNLFCSLSIWDREKQQWVVKQDVGTESNTEREKGEASDSFKRACINIGIGRELYTQPLILFSTLPEERIEKQDKNGRAIYALKPKVKFRVSQIAVSEDKVIQELEIKDQDGEIRFRWQLPKEDGPVCSQCGGLIKPAKRGKELWDIKSMEEYSLSRYGRKLCIGCMKTAEKALEEAEKNGVAVRQG